MEAMGHSEEQVDVRGTAGDMLLHPDKVEVIGQTGAVLAGYLAGMTTCAGSLIDDEHSVIHASALLTCTHCECTAMPPVGETSWLVRTLAQPALSTLFSSGSNHTPW